jgi:hypothetical protein
VVSLPLALDGHRVQCRHHTMLYVTLFQAGRYEEAIHGDIEINPTLPPHLEEEPSMFEMNPLWTLIQPPPPAYPPKLHSQCMHLR